MTNSVARVFVTQESQQLNYSPAEEFGEVVFLTRDEVSQVSGSLINAAIVNEIRAKLATFNPAFDFIAPSGSPVVSGIVFALLGVIFAARKGTTIRVLRWSNRDRLYQPIAITIN